VRIIVECSQEETIRHVIPFRLIPPIHPLDEEASQKPNTDIFLAIPTRYLLSTLYSAIRQVRRASWPRSQLHNLRDCRYVLQNAFSSAFQSGTAIVDDIRSGFLTKMLATPVKRTAILFEEFSATYFELLSKPSSYSFSPMLSAYSLRTGFQDTCSSFSQWPPLGSPGPDIACSWDSGPKVRRLSLNSRFSNVSSSVHEHCARRYIADARLDEERI